METLSRSSIINKLNKLKAFIERDCGNESINAQRIADRLIKEYGITSREFSYVHFSVKQKYDAANAQRERERYEARARERESVTAWRVSYTSLMRDVVLALIDTMQLSRTTEGGKIFVQCSASDYARFECTLDGVKTQWANSVRAINNEFVKKIRETF